MRASDRTGEAAGDAKKKIRDGVAAEVVAKGERATMTAGFETVDLAAGDLDSRGPDVPPARFVQIGGVAEPVLRAIDRNEGAGAQPLDDAAGIYRGSDGVGLRNQQGTHPFVAR